MTVFGKKNQTRVTRINVRLAEKKTQTWMVKKK